MTADANISESKRHKLANRAMKQMSQPRLLSAFHRQVRAEHQEKFYLLLIKLLERSLSAGESAKNRAAVIQQTATETEKFLKKTDPDLGITLLPSPRKPRLQVTGTDRVVPAFHDFYRVEDATDKTGYRVARAQTYLAELLLKKFPKSVEVQVAFSADKKKLMVSSNVDAQNKAIAKYCRNKTAGTLMANLISQYKFELAEFEELDQSDRRLRHAAKLRQRWEDVLDPSAEILVPHPVKNQNGKHAELRIVHDPAYNIREFHLPTGVREPCIACAIALHEKTGLAPARTTALWPTAPIRIALELVGASVRKIAKRLCEGIVALAEKKVRFTEESRIRGDASNDQPATTDAHAADSESDLEGSELAS